jgi:hypothetical protein
VPGPHLHTFLAACCFLAVAALFSATVAAFGFTIRHSQNGRLQEGQPQSRLIVECTQPGSGFPVTTLQSVSVTLVTKGCKSGFSLGDDDQVASAGLKGGSLQQRCMNIFIMSSYLHCCTR